MFDHQQIKNREVHNINLFTNNNGKKHSVHAIIYDIIVVTVMFFTLYFWV